VGVYEVPQANRAFHPRTICTRCKSIGEDLGNLLDVSHIRELLWTGASTLCCRARDPQRSVRSLPLDRRMIANGVRLLLARRVFVEASVIAMGNCFVVYRSRLLRRISDHPESALAIPPIGVPRGPSLDVMSMWSFVF